MADTVLGSAALNLKMDTSEATLAVERFKQTQVGLGQTAQQEVEKMTRGQRRVVQGLEAQIAKLSLTRSEMLQYNVISKTTGATQEALLAKIKANTAAIEQQGRAADKTSVSMNKFGISAKQQAAAMRGVPAQITDIFTSLQGGQNPLTVLLQQGGQLKDMFGGIVPAARALGGSLAGMINPLTIMAAVLGTAVVALVSAEARANDFNRALILTGNQSRITADDLNSIATRLDDISGVTARQAADALIQIVANGRIAASQYELVTEAAVRMEDATGKAVKETVQEYADLARDPVNAILRLNESEQFLTQSVYERIRAMQEAGDIEGAAALATETRAASQIARAQDVVESLGLISGAWHAIKENTGEAWDEAVNYFGQLDRDAKEAMGTLSRMAAALRSGGPGAFLGVQAALTPLAANPTQHAGPPKINSEAQKQLDALIAGNRSREESQKLEITRIRNLGKEAGLASDKIEQLVAASNKAYEASKPKGNGASEARALANAASQAALQAIKNQEDTQRSEIQNTSRVLQAEYSARLVTTTDYYGKQRELVQSDIAAQETSLKKQIEFLRSRSVAGKDSVNVGKQLAELESRLAKVRADGATQLAILGIQEKDVSEKRARAVDAYRESLNTANEAARQSADASLARIVLGQREAEFQERLATITADTAEKQRQLAREFAETNDFSAYQEKLSALQAYSDEQVRIVEDGYARMTEAQGDWLNGLKGGLAQWMEGSSNVAEQINAITTRSLDGATEALTNFAMTGKLAWRDLLSSIASEIIKFMMKQAVLQFIKMFMGSWGGGTTGTSLGMTDFGGGVSPTMAADGGVFSGAKGLSKHSGTVVSQPTPFYFAKGAGIMGEAGDEGIFPLARGADGKLGVRAMGGGGGGDVYVTTNLTVNGDGSSSKNSQTAGEQANMYRELASNISIGAQQEIQKALLPGGIIWKARGG